MNGNHSEAIGTMILPNLLNLTSLSTMTEAPNTTDGGEDNYVDPTETGLEWFVWIVLGGSFICLFSSIIGYAILVWLPRRGYTRIENERKERLAFAKLLEEMRGRPRRVELDASLTESERHFLVHDFADFP